MNKSQQEIHKFLQEQMLDITRNGVKQFIESDLKKQLFTGTSVGQLVEIFRSLGYHVEWEDVNGWEYDFWYSVNKGNYYNPNETEFHIRGSFYYAEKGITIVRQ